MSEFPAFGAHPTHSPTHESPSDLPVPACEQERADCYAWIAALLLSPPDSLMLEVLARIDPTPPLTPLAAAWSELGNSARRIDPEHVADEYEALFAGMGRPMVDPYHSRYYLRSACGATGGHPLVDARADFRSLGIECSPLAGIAEDHLGALSEAMCALIAGAGDVGPRTLTRQRRFFEARIAPWHRACLDDIAKASTTGFYRCVARFAQTFFALEAEAFALYGSDEAPLFVPSPSRARELGAQR